MKYPEIRVGSRKIGQNYPPLIIVELGINHNGNLKLAKKLILSAKKAGAEIIKHQTHVLLNRLKIHGIRWVFPRLYCDRKL